MTGCHVQWAKSASRERWLGRCAIGWLARCAILCLMFSLVMLAGNARAADPVAVLQQGMSGDDVCTACHGVDDARPILSIHQTRHGVAGQPGCQACHGSSRAHVQHRDDTVQRPPADFVFRGSRKSSAELQSRTCLNCHKAGQRIHWPDSAHAGGDVTCASCHTVHRPQDPALDRTTQNTVCFSCHVAQRAQQHYLSNHAMASGALTCGDCHNVHGSTGPAMLRANTINESCFTCHADKRGPFLWEHPPASDDCSNCHVPHGSNIAPLLRVRPPWLCQSCHGGSVHTGPAFSGRGLPQGAGGTGPAQQLLLRACTNCHSAIHGSNHPSGARFTR